MSSKDSNRAQWGTRLGFILAAAGSAVGLGNLWKFPYITWKYEGGAFVMVYLLAILIVGLPIMIAEIMIGKKTGKNPVGAFRSLQQKTSWFPWTLIGWMGLASGFIILSYYSVVAGWTLGYATKAIRGDFSVIYHNAEKHVTTVLATEGPEKEQLLKSIPSSSTDSNIKQRLIDKEAGDQMGKSFGEFLGNPRAQVGLHLLFMFLTMGIVVWGISGGIERASKMLMPVLFILLLFLMATSIATGGISKTLAYLFTWNLSTLTPASILEALGHAFFSLSLGMGAMLTYGSYLNRDADIVKSALYITILDTSVALLACLMLFPIILHFNLQPGSASIGILFTTLPVVFNQMPMGNLVSIIFFCLLAFAALTSAISLLEVVVSYMIDEKGWSRKSSSLLVGSLIFLLGLPAALCNGASPFFSKIVIFKNEGKWMNWFDSFDYLATNWFLPLGGLFIALCVGWALTDEDRLGEFTLIDGNSLIYRYFRFSIRYLAPVLVFVVLLNKIGLI